MQRPTFDNSFNLGHVFMTLSVLTAMFGYVISQTEWKKDIESKNDLQDERIAQLGKSLEEIKIGQAKTIEALGTIRSTVMVIDERTKKGMEN